MISSAGFPNRHTGSAVNPASTSLRTLCSSILSPTFFSPGYLTNGITWITLTWMGTRSPLPA